MFSYDLKRNFICIDLNINCVRVSVQVPMWKIGLKVSQLVLHKLHKHLCYLSGLCIRNLRTTTTWMISIKSGWPFCDLPMQIYLTRHFVPQPTYVCSLFKYPILILLQRVFYVSFSHGRVNSIHSMTVTVFFFQIFVSNVFLRCNDFF